MLHGNLDQWCHDRRPQGCGGDGALVSAVHCMPSGSGSLPPTRTTLPGRQRLTASSRLLGSGLFAQIHQPLATGTGHNGEKSGHRSSRGRGRAPRALCQESKGELPETSLMCAAQSSCHRMWLIFPILPDRDCQSAAICQLPSLAGQEAVGRLALWLNLLRRNDGRCGGSPPQGQRRCDW